MPAAELFVTTLFLKALVTVAALATAAIALSALKTCAVVTEVVADRVVENTPEEAVIPESAESSARRNATAVVERLSAGNDDVVPPS